MSNDARHNRAFHVRARGRVHQLLGEVKEGKGDVPFRAVIVEIAQRNSAENPTGENWKVSCLVFGSAALCGVGQDIDCAGSVVDFGTRLEGKEVKPKLVFSANSHCQLNEGGGGEGLYVALAGRVGWVGKSAMVGGLLELPVGVAIADFPAMVGVLLRGQELYAANKHDLLLTEGDVVRFGLSKDGKRPALTAVAINARIAFTTSPEKGEPT